MVVRRGASNLSSHEPSGRGRIGMPMSTSVLAHGGVVALEQMLSRRGSPVGAWRRRGGPDGGEGEGEAPAGGRQS